MLCKVDRDPDHDRKPLLAEAPWWIIAVIGAMVLCVGITLGTSPLSYGGADEIGVVLIAASGLVLKYQHR
jgi:hypothetical protein